MQQSFLKWGRCDLSLKMNRHYQHFRDNIVRSQDKYAIVTQASESKSQETQPAIEIQTTSTFEKTMTFFKEFEKMNTPANVHVAKKSLHVPTQKTVILVKDDENGEQKGVRSRIDSMEGIDVHSRSDNTKSIDVQSRNDNTKGIDFHSLDDNTEGENSSYDHLDQVRESTIHSLYVDEQKEISRAMKSSRLNKSTTSTDSRSRLWDNSANLSISSTPSSSGTVKSGLIIGHSEDKLTKKSSLEQSKYGTRVFCLNVVRGGVRDIWKIRAYVSKPNGSKEVVRVCDNKDGTITITYRPSEVGQHQLYVLHNSVNMLGSPIDFVVLSEPEGPFSVSGEGLQKGEVGKPSRFTVYSGAFRSNKKLTIVIEGRSKVHLDRRDNHDGTLDIIWVAEEPGSYKISLKFDGVNVKGSPFNAIVR